MGTQCALCVLVTNVSTVCITSYENRCSNSVPMGSQYTENHIVHHKLWEQMDHIVHNESWEQGWPQCTMYWRSVGPCCALQVIEQGRPVHSMPDLCFYRELCLCPVLFHKISNDENMCISYKTYIFIIFIVSHVRTLNYVSLCSIQVFNILLLVIGTVSSKFLLNRLFHYRWNNICHVGFVFPSLSYFT
jgi:hypothetical protein